MIPIWALIDPRKLRSFILYEIAIPQAIKMLKNLNAILGKAAIHAETKKFDIQVLLSARLAPDQFSLLKQVQIVTDTVKLCASRLIQKTECY